MNAIRVRTKVKSETLRLPELKPLIGKNVEIIVLEEGASMLAQPRPFDFAKNFGRGWPGGKRDGFESAVRRWRRTDKPRDLPE